VSIAQQRCALSRNCNQIALGKNQRENLDLKNYSNGQTIRNTSGVELFQQARNLLHDKAKSRSCAANFPDGQSGLNLSLKPQFSPQITQINADYHAVMNEHRIIQKVSKQIKATRCLICGNLCNLRATKFFRFIGVSMKRYAHPQLHAVGVMRKCKKKAPPP
jgi:hypothetical protein